MNGTVARKDVPAEHRWKLEDLFADQGAWDKEYQEVKQLLAKVKQYEGKLNNANSIKECFELDDEISQHTERLYVYANMRHHEDMPSLATRRCPTKPKSSAWKPEKRLLISLRKF